MSWDGEAQGHFASSFTRQSQERVRVVNGTEISWAKIMMVVRLGNAASGCNLHAQQRRDENKEQRGSNNESGQVSVSTTKWNDTSAAPTGGERYRRELQ